MNALQTLTKELTEGQQLDYVLFDGSGSMMEKWWNSLQALEIYTEDLRKLNTHIRVATFDSANHNLVQRDCDSKSCPSFITQPLESSFLGTPLYDAIAQMCWHLRDLNPTRCTILIVTDGEEYDSKFTTLAQAKCYLDWCRAKGWSVVFMGANFNNSMQAKELGMSEENCIGVQKELMSDAAKLLGYKRTQYAHGGKNISFTDDERKHFGGLLPAPGK